MKSFVDRIIETDRKAKELLEQAQAEKRRLMEDAKERAEKYLQQQELKIKQGRAAIDLEFAEKAQKAAHQADKDYLCRKQTLDKAFEEGRIRWLEEIRENILYAQQAEKG